MIRRLVALEARLTLNDTVNTWRLYGLYLTIFFVLILYLSIFCVLILFYMDEQDQDTLDEIPLRKEVEPISWLGAFLGMIGCYLILRLIRGY